MSLSSEDYKAIAYAVNERRLESRSVAHRKVIELAADVAAVLYRADPDLNLGDFYRSCGFNATDMQTLQDRTAAITNHVAKYTYAQLVSLPTIRQTQTDNLKVEVTINGVDTRVWVSRLTREDDVPRDNEVTVEAYLGSYWITVDTYEPQH